MFDKEGKKLTDNDIVFISKMNRIRNYLYHNGLSLQEISEKEDNDCIEFLGKYKLFTYRKFLEFFGIVGKFADYKGGIFEWRLKVIEESNEETIFELNEIQSNIFNKIREINKIDGIIEKAELIWNNITYKIQGKLTYDLIEHKHIMKMTHLPMEFKTFLYNRGVTYTNLRNQPEDLIKKIQHLEVKLDLGDLHLSVMIKSYTLIKTNFDF